MPGATHGAAARGPGVQRRQVKSADRPELRRSADGRVTVSRCARSSSTTCSAATRSCSTTPASAQALTGRVVMVSGAGGSIGAELCRQIARFQPRLLVMFELSEYSVFESNEELSDAIPPSASPRSATCGTSARVEGSDREIPAGVVFHAAAYKHVPLMEEKTRGRGPEQRLRHCARRDAAAAHGVERFVLISTDKAVNPVNVMGARSGSPSRSSRRCSRGGMALMAVRFGNVLGSPGSVIPKFREQIERGGPITVTHPDIIRYFMSIPEAAQLVLQAGLWARAARSSCSTWASPFASSISPGTDPALRHVRKRDFHRVHGLAAGREARRSVCGSRGPSSSRPRRPTDLCAVRPAADAAGAAARQADRVDLKPDLGLGRAATRGDSRPDDPHLCAVADPRRTE